MPHLGHMSKKRSTDASVHPESSDVEALPEGVELKFVVLHCLDQEVEYGYEYLDCNSVPLFDSRANNYIIALTQVLLMHVQ